MRRWAIGAIVVAAILAVAGCKQKHSTSGVSTNGDESHHPDVIFESPIPDEEGVSEAAIVTAIFDDPMNPTTITTGSFFLRILGGPPVAGTVTYDVPSRTATFTPSALLLSSTTYVAEISTFVQNTSGESLGVAHAWQFRTADPPVPP